jgi:eukaryotic-like serine/threonine-protein kinase
MNDKRKTSLNPAQLDRLLGLVADRSDGTSDENQAISAAVHGWLHSPLDNCSCLPDPLHETLCVFGKIFVKKPLIDLLLDTATKPTVLKTLASCAQEYSLCVNTSAEEALALTLYYAALAGLLVFHQQESAEHSPESLVESFTDLKAKPWLPSELKQHLDRACQICLEKRSCNRNETAQESPEDQVSSQSDDAPLQGPHVQAALDRWAEGVGSRIGCYRLLRVLGEGGMGIVYLAEQQGQIRRRVALKVLKPGMDSARVLARFEAERQALALLDHPNIAQVHDAGTTGAGRPYFVMEHVKGLPMTEYCDQRKLSIEDRLALFIQVCHAVQHAHQKGIIHRDIKPSNLLVTSHEDQAVPKIIDFGVSKALIQPLTERTLYTEQGQLFGTPEYMSPEQADMAGEDIDTRSDIYSLGVLLYELLTGVLPFDSDTLHEGGIDHIRKVICETDPRTPSTRLTKLGDEAREVAKNRRIEIAALAKCLHRELEWIPLKAMRKERTERYRSASELADDIEHYLTGNPLLAGPPSTVYKVGKFVTRNRSLVASGVAIVVICLLATVVSVSQMITAKRAERIAELAREEEAVQRQRAETEELNARRRAYASDMNLVTQALSQDNLGRARDLLNRHRPSTSASHPVSSIDLRGWEWRYLWKQSQSESTYELCRITSEVTSLAVSHDGKWLAIGGSDNDGASVWDLPRREQLAVLHPEEHVMRVAFSPRDPLLAFSGVSILDAATQPRLNSEHDCIRLWDGKSRQIVGELPLEGSCVGLQFSEDGASLLSSEKGFFDFSPRKNRITVWSMPEGERVVSYASSQTGVKAGTPFAVDRDKRLAVHALGSRVRVVDLSTGQQRWSAQATAGENVSALALTRDGELLASSALFSESTIRLWEVASGQEIGRLEGHRTWIGDLHFWPDGKTLASASADQTIRLWDVSDPHQGRLVRTLRGHTAEVWRITLLPDNKTLISGAKDGSVYIWDTEKPPHDVGSVTLTNIAAWSFAPDGKGVLTLNRDRQITQHWGPGLQQRKPLFDLTKNISARPACFSPDSRLLATRSNDGTVSIWDVWSGSKRHSFICPPITELVAFLDKGNRLATVNRRTDSHDIWDIATGKRTASWPGAARLGSTRAQAFSADERWSLTLGKFRGPGILRDMSSGQQTYPMLEIHKTSGIAFSPSGKHIAASSFLGTVKLWETENLREVATLQGHLQAGNSVVFSPDGKRLAAGLGGLETVKIWDVESHQELLTLYEQGGMYSQTAFSPDGNTLGSMNSRGRLNLWQAPSWADIERAEASLARR